MDKECRIPDGMLRLAGWVDDSIVDGPGLRFTVFTQGCPHACPGCHNPHTHAFEGGKLESVASLLDRIRANPLLDGVTLSGGEPFEQAPALTELASGAHALGLSVMTYSGYTLERLIAPQGEAKGWPKLLAETDILVDGPFVARLRNPLLRFRGSSNQRILDARASLRLGRAVPLEEESLLQACFARIGTT